MAYYDMASAGGGMLAQKSTTKRGPSRFTVLLAASGFVAVAGGTLLGVFAGGKPETKTVQHVPPAPKIEARTDPEAPVSDRKPEHTAGVASSGAVLLGTPTMPTGTIAFVNIPPNAVCPGGCMVGQPAVLTTTDLITSPSDSVPAEPAVKPVPSVQPFSFDQHGLGEYQTVATEVGIVPAELTILELRSYLAEHKIPTYDTAKVVSYMDKIAASDNPDRYGWHWAPLRASDARDISLGRESVGYTNSCLNCSTTTTGGTMAGVVWANGATWSGNSYTPRTAASDYYNGSKTPYARTIPLHALQLIAQIEHQFAGKVSFMVSDYTTEPNRIVSPDPFLMAIIPNDKLSTGEGRFIIDAWDEPGFGVGPKDDEVTAP